MLYIKAHTVSQCLDTSEGSYLHYKYRKRCDYFPNSPEDGTQLTLCTAEKLVHFNPSLNSLPEIKRQCREV